MYGATRGDELTRVELKDIKEHGELFVITIPETKTKIVRKFTLENEGAGYLRKYLALRPATTTSTRFFLNYQKGKCYNQHIGKNKFLDAPKVVATFLNLPDAHRYTGHSFRRTSANLVVDGGGDILTLKRHGGWRSSSAAEGYLEDSITNKRKIGQAIERQIDSSAKRHIGEFNAEQNDLPRTFRSPPTSTITSSSATTGESVLEESITCSQSVVNIVRSSQRVPLQSVGNLMHVDGSTKEIGVPPTIGVRGSSEHEQQMNFHNCTVHINFR